MKLLPTTTNLAGAAAAAWLLAAPLLGGTACGSGSPLPPNVSGLVSVDAGGGGPPLGCDAESLQDFTSRALPEAFGCGACHTLGGSNPTGLGMAWGTGSGPTPEKWHAAAYALANRADQAGLPLAETSLSVHFNGGVGGNDPTHPVNAEAKAAVEGWLEVLRGLECDQPDAGVVDAGPPDAGPPPPVDAGCFPTPEQSEADFVARAVADQYSCATCHRIPGTSPTARAGSWGVNTGTPTPEQWHEAVYNLATADDQKTLAPDQTTLYAHFNGGILPGDDDHPVNEAGKSVIVEWLNAIRAEVPCGGDPLDGGVVDGGI